MTEQEIIKRFRWLKGTTNQKLQILAELNGCSRQRIANTIGVEVQKTPPKRKKKIWTAEEDALLLQMRRDGESLHSVARAIGVSYGSIRLRNMALEGKHG